MSRVASRAPLYGGPQAIVRPKFVAEWFKQLQHLDAFPRHRGRSATA
jgi:hypothetical protein